MPHAPTTGLFHLAVVAVRLRKGTDMAKPTSNTNGLLTVKQAAAYVPCSETTIKRRIRSGELPFKTFGESGRKYFISLEDLEKLMATRSFRKTTEGDRIEAIARAIAAEAPELTAERKAKLASLLS